MFNHIIWQNDNQASKLHENKNSMIIMTIYVIYKTRVYATL